MELIISLLAGAVGGNVAGGLLKNHNLGARFGTPLPVSSAAASVAKSSGHWGPGASPMAAWTLPA